jgi:hypothetical protein
MKLIIREYLASLRERGELDAILPDLLSQMGLNVYSKPARGTRQHGVDVGAVGSLNGAPEKVYLFSIKAGDLTRKEWDGDAVQSLRPSLNEILDAYIPDRIPLEHREKDVVICVTIGGDVHEQVRDDLTGFVSKNATRTITFEEWNGDRLASLIQSNFLREDLLPPGARSQLRKALALLDEPDAAYQHFAALIRLLSDTSQGKNANRVRAIRHMPLDAFRLGARKWQYGGCVSIRRTLTSTCVEHPQRARRRELQKGGPVAHRVLVCIPGISPDLRRISQQDSAAREQTACTVECSSRFLQPGCKPQTL